MRVIGTDINAAMFAELLEANPDIGLDVFNQMPKVNRPIGIGQCCGNEDLTCLVHRRLQSLFLLPEVAGPELSRS